MLEKKRLKENGRFLKSLRIKNMGLGIQKPEDE